MYVIKRFLWIYLIAISVLWWLCGQIDWNTVTTFFSWRGVMVQYTGVVSMSVMSLAMILSVRPSWLENHFDGLDKMYRLHKWLGITALIASTSHWLIAKAPKWLVQLGVITRPHRMPRPDLPPDSLQTVMMHWRGTAEGLGEWAFYGTIILIVLALIKRLPYRWFSQIHRIFPVAYLILVFHAVVLLQFADWPTLLGITMATLMALGTLAAILSLTGRKAGKKQINATISRLERHDTSGIISVDIALQSNWQGHQPGQFAFVTFDKQEGPHPFTIASAWQNDGQLRFMIKSLGDYTNHLTDRLAIGQSLQLEGPYGRFTLEAPTRKQIWIGGGIGITPFVAGLQALPCTSQAQPVDFIHTTSIYDNTIIQQLQQDASQRGVNLHVLWDKRDGRLDAQRLTEMVPDWCEADIWFCGPSGFGRQLQEGLQAMGLPTGRFHQELFEMR